MRVVRTRSIPNVDDDRLIGDLQRLHREFHTAAGLRQFDGPRRNLVNNGIKARKIATELGRRGHQPTTCRYCRPHD